MVTVPVYQQQVGNDAPNGARIADVAPPGAFGGGVAQAAAGVGQSLDQAASAADQIQAMHDQTAATSYLSQAQGQLSNILYGDGKTTLGYLGMSGEDALNGRQAAVDQINAIRDQTLGAAQNARQQQILQEKLDNWVQDTKQTVVAHAQTAELNYADQVNNAAVQQDAQSYVGAVIAGDQTKAALYRNLMLVRRAKALDLKGIPLQQADGSANPAAQIAMMNDITPAHQQVIANLLSTGQPADIQRAYDYFQANQGDMDAATRAGVGAQVSAAYNGSGARAAAVAQAGLSGAPAAQDAALNSKLGIDTSAGPTTGVPAQAASARNLIVQAGGTPQEADDLARIAMLESSGGKSMKNTQPGSTSAGWWGFTDKTWATLGGTAANRNDPAAQAQMALKLYRQDQAGLAQALGRQPSTMELYLAHQQGLGGAEALLKANAAAPSTLASTVLAPLYGGDQAQAARVIAQNGGQATSTVGQFLQTWAGRVNGASAGQSAAMAPPTTSSTAPQPLGDKNTFVQGVISRAPPGASPDVLAQYRAAGESFWNQRQGDISNAQQVAGQQIDQAFANAAKTGQTLKVGDIPDAVIAQAAPDKQRSTYEALSSYGQHPKINDDNAVAYLHNEMVRDPDAFANEDMTKWITKLDPSTWNSILNTQDSARRGTGEFQDKRQTVDQVMSGAQSALIGAGLNPKQPAHAEQIAQLQTKMLGWSDQFQAQNSRPPTAKETRDQLDSYLLQGTASGPGLPTQHLHVFELSGQPGFQYDIPPGAQNALQQAYAAKGGQGQMPRAQMVRYYLAGHQQGVF